MTYFIASPHLLIFSIWVPYLHIRTYTSTYASFHYISLCTASPLKGNQSFDFYEYSRVNGKQRWDFYYPFKKKKSSLLFYNYFCRLGFCCLLLLSRGKPKNGFSFSFSLLHLLKIYSLFGHINRGLMALLWRKVVVGH